MSGITYLGWKPRLKGNKKYFGKQQALEKTMANNFSEEYIRREVANVMHPTINCSLVELGIVKNIEIKTGKVIITMMFPFPNIPIADYLVDSVRESIEEIDPSVEVETGLMNKEELQKFLALEKGNHNIRGNNEQQH